jgi:hypothetical protein
LWRRLCRSRMAGAHGGYQASVRSIVSNWRCPRRACAFIVLKA